jgi:hypothetical protein
VSVVGGDFLPGDEAEIRATVGGKVGVVADGVVVGDGEEIEATSACSGSQFSDAAPGVRVMAVGVQVTFDPPRTAMGHQVDRIGGRSLFRKLPLNVGHEDLQEVVTTPGGYLVEPEENVPDARDDRTRQIPWRGSVLGHDHLVPFTATPSTKPLGCEELAPPRIKQTEIEDVARLAIVSVADLDPLRSPRNREREKPVR